jgi:phosphinothricin acetyltransferase
MTIRPATRDDLPGILRIYNHAVKFSTATADHEPQPLETRTAWFESHLADELPVLVAVDGGRLVGWAALNRWNVRLGYRFTVENSVYVEEGERGRGVGTKLLGGLVAEAKRLGLHAILAGIDSENVASLALHARHGFVEVGRLKQVVHKFDRWLDVVYLELVLD